MNGVSIRLARADEVERLGEIEARACDLFDGTEVFSDLNGEIYDPHELSELIVRGQVWVACLEHDEPVGFIIVLHIDDVLHVEELDVLPEFGRRGIGAALLEHACQWGNKNGFIAATLSTFRDVPWNAPFYARHGFQTLEPSEFTPWMVGMREIEKQKDLPVDKRVIMRRPLS
jgi:4-diphosphocytidyl-2-C-methyl-D-erythritol kinase